ncbi:MAG: hypothetical protein GYB68_08275 [Chloroflexi bacterium]|nr:hypothetical protein [Chloroflexota bacterium]
MMQQQMQAEPRVKHQEAQQGKQVAGPARMSRSRRPVWEDTMPEEPVAQPPSAVQPQSAPPAEQAPPASDTGGVVMSRARRGSATPPAADATGSSGVNNPLAPGLSQGGQVKPPGGALPDSFFEEEKPTPDETPQAEEEFIPPGFMRKKPELSSRVYQYYLPAELNVTQAVRNYEAWTHQPIANASRDGRLLYRPSLLAQTVVRFEHKKTSTYETWTYAFVVPELPRVPYLNWLEYASDPFDPRALDGAPPPDFGSPVYEDLGQEVVSGPLLKDLERNLEDWIYQNVALTVFYNPVLKLYSGLGEDQRDFFDRVQAAARYSRDEEVDKIAESYDAKLARLEEKAQKTALRLDKEQGSLEFLKREELFTAGEAFTQLLKGRTAYTLSRTSRVRRYSEGAKDQITALEQELARVADQLQQVEADMERDLYESQERWADAVRQVEEIRVTPYKKNINIALYGVGWVPYWMTTLNNQISFIPATTSGLAYAQSPITLGGQAGGYSSQSTYGGGW